MRLNRTLRVGLALLFALMLPLQGYAAMPSCGRLDHTVQYPNHAATHHCTHGLAITHHPGCGDCCCVVAIAPTRSDWAAPRLAAPENSHTLIWSPPTVALDRLDRPPRLTTV
jgi:hypothetical protein